MNKSYPTKKLGEVIEVIESGSRPKGGAVAFGIPSLGVEHINDDGTFNINTEEVKYVPENFFKNLNRGKIKKFDILIAKDGATTGKTVIVGDNFPFDKASVNEHLFIIRGNPKIIFQKFLFYTLFGPEGKKQILKTKHGAAQGGIDQSFINVVKIPLPPLATQTQIVERLDKIAEAQKLNNDLIQKSDELFQSLLHQELNPAGKNWEVKKMEVLVKNVKIGPFGSALKIAELSDNGPVRVLFIENVVNNKFELAKEKYISEKKHKELEVYTVEPDDILITMMGTIGRTCITPKNLGRAIISSHLIKITPDKKIAIPEYLNFSLHSPYVTDQIRRKAKGAIMKGLNSKILRNLDVPLPPLETQKQIVAKLSAVQDYKKQLLVQKSKLKELFDSALAKSMNT